MLKPVKLAALAVVGAALSASCAAATTTANSLTAPPLSSTRAPSSWWSVYSAMPLTSYQVPDPEQETIFKAIKALEITCMHGKGYADYSASDMFYRAETPESRLISGTGGPFGYIDAANAESYGFHPPEITPPATSEVSTENEQSAAHACDTLATQKVPWQPPLAHFLGDLMATAEISATSDGRVVTAAKKWSACMRGHGFNEASDPNTFAVQWRSRPSGSKPGSAEVTAAETDVTCTVDSNLAGVYFGVLSGYQQELATANSVDLGKVRQQIAAEVADADAIVRSGR